MQEWVKAKKKYRLSDVQIQMARELGMNPKKFGSLANHKQEPWKAPLPDFIEDIYFKRFKKDRPGCDNQAEIVALATDYLLPTLNNVTQRRKQKEIHYGAMA